MATVENTAPEIKRGAPYCVTIGSVFLVLSMAAESKSAWVPISISIVLFGFAIKRNEPPKFLPRILVGFAAFFLLVLAIMPKHSSGIDGIKESCSDQFKDDAAAANDCVISVYGKRLKDEQTYKLDKADQGAN